MRTESDDQSGRQVRRAQGGRKAGLARTEQQAAAERMPGRLVVNAADAAARIRARGVAMRPSTLAAMRTRGGGPAYLRLNARAVVYPLDLLDAWLDERLAGPGFGSTAEEPARRGAP
ncbi:hypothetical protein [Amaricoccus sp.]|uniref:helix-turn-helix transcriptional regulator n=1 Tax=Amaricoccus sp. TaxID=1872485 RepID=UPI001B6DB7F9|nr:hypothetical protein [Amaricoccus sp.]MBP7002281.1 hypothetical protein [Amaricoccus sp.]